MALVAVGFKTKVAAFSLVILLLLQNVIYNAFWTIASGAVYHRDLAKCVTGRGCVMGCVMRCVLWLSIQ